MFTQNGLYITTEGYFLSRWNEDQEKYAGRKLSLSEIETHLNSEIVLADNACLKDVFQPILESQVLATVYYRLHWAEIIQEIKSKPWPEYNPVAHDDILYVEVYDCYEINVEENMIENTFGKLNFHGWSAKTDFPYSLSATSLADYMNTPVKMGKFSIQDSTLKMVIKDVEFNTTLNNFLYAIVYDMSFFGVGEKRDNFLQHI